MTDSHNTGKNKDPQMANLQYEICDKSVSKLKEKEKSNNASALAGYYEKGINHFKKYNLLIELEKSGDHCGHNIWILSKPIPIKGINYPNDYWVYRPIYDNEDFKVLQSAYNSIEDVNVKDFWEPIVFPRTRDNNLSLYAERLNQMKKVKDKYSISEVFYDYHTHDPSEKGIFGKLAHGAKTWVPSLDWFDDNLKELTFDEIFTLLPQAERNILKLWLGRVGVGRSRHIPINSDKPLEHTARMAVVLLSKQAGLGKSTLTRYLYGALNKCGFSVESFRETREKFGMGSAAKAHILEKDDISEESLLSFLKAEETKILISNGKILTEEKFVKAEAVDPRCCILLNSNSWSSTYGYSIDSGIASRIKCISTYTLEELQKLKTTIGGNLKGCPDLRPFAMFPWLAEKYNCDIEAIMLYATRLASDYFYEIINDTSDPSVNKLEEEVYKHTARLRYRFKTDILNSLVKALTLSSAVMSILRGEEPYLPEFNFKHFYSLCKDYYFLCVDPSAIEFCNLLKEDWINTGSTTIHPYQSLRDIRLDTLKQAISWAQDNYIDFLNDNSTLNVNENEVLKKYIGFIIFRDGFKLGPSTVYFIEAINSICYQIDEINNLAYQLVEKMKDSNPLILERISKYANNKIKVDDDWMNNKNYSPKIGDKLRRKELERKFLQT